MYYLRLLFGFVCALAAALFAQWINLPLPWMLGPLIVVILLKTNKVPISCHRYIRKTGQWVIGVSLGLYFTPEVFGVLQNMLGFIIAASVFTVLLGISGAWLMQKINRVDFKSAFFSATIGGASEMTNLAARNGVDTELVAANHSIRVLMVVFLIPVAYRTLGIHGDTAFHDVSSYVSWLGIGELLLYTVPLIIVMERFRLPNPWILGSLLVTAGLVASGLHMSHLYGWMSDFAQLFIAWFLGDQFKPGFFKKAFHLMIGQFVIVSYYILAAFLFGLIIAFFSGISMPTIMLGLSPGGITEMTMTAKVLMLGVALVTAFHVSRLVFVLISTEPLFHWLEKRRNK